MSKIKIEDIKESIASVGWQLVSQEYKNLKTDLEVICPEGHTNFVSYEKWRRGSYECPICKQNPFNNADKIATKKKGYRILAFDQASITSGWAVFDDKNLINYGKWTSDGCKSTARIASTKFWVASMINNWKPDEVIFEDIQLQKFKSENGLEGDAVLVFKKLAHLQGVLKNYCYEIGLPYKVVSPSTWRSHSDIKGRARTDKKKNAQLKIKKLFDVSVTQDEADAILIGLWAADEHASSEIIIF